MRRKHLVLLGLGTALLGSAVGTARWVSAKDKKEDAKPAKPKGVSEYDGQINDANKSFAAGMAGGATDDAIAEYRKAIAMDPTRPEGHLFLAGALYHKGEFASAEEAATTAVSRSKADLKNFANWHGKALFVVATIKETLKKPDEAKVAWKEYADFAKDNPDKPYPEGSGRHAAGAAQGLPGQRRRSAGEARGLQQVDHRLRQGQGADHEASEGARHRPDAEARALIRRRDRRVRCRV